MYIGWAKTTIKIQDFREYAIILANCVFSEFKDFVKDFDSDFKGMTLSNSEKIRTIHNSYAKQTVFEVDKSMIRTSKEDPFHFVTYLPINGKLVELDGLQSSPIDHGAIQR